MSQGLDCLKFKNAIEVIGVIEGEFILFPYNNFTAFGFCYLMCVVF